MRFAALNCAKELAEVVPMIELKIDFAKQMWLAD